MNNQRICKACGKGKLTICCQYRIVLYRKTVKRILHYYDKCSICTIYYTNGDRIIANQEEINKFKRKVDENYRINGKNSKRIDRS